MDRALGMTCDADFFPGEVAWRNGVGARIHAVAGANGGRDASWDRASLGLRSIGIREIGIGEDEVVLFGEFYPFHLAVPDDGALLGR